MVQVLNKITETATDVIESTIKVAEHYDPSLENRAQTFGGNAQPAVEGQDSKEEENKVAVPG